MPSSKCLSSSKAVTSNKHHAGVKLRRCYVFSILYYGMESWTLTEATPKTLEAFEMWLYRRILRISWVDKVTNETILERMGKEKEVMKTI